MTPHTPAGRNTITSWPTGLARTLCGAVALLLPALAHAALTDIASVPVQTLTTVSAKPNIMFILDDSGSMAWDYMPDDANGSSQYGYWSSQCNGVAYDPTYDYKPPIKADGTSYANQPFTGAWPDGYNPTPDGSQGYGASNSHTPSTGDKVFTFSAGIFDFGSGGIFGALSGLPNWSVGDQIAIVDANDANHWMIGTVKSNNKSGICPLYCSSTVTITVTSFNGDHAGSNWALNELQRDNLSSRYYYRYTGSQTRMNWTYAGTTSSADSTTTFYRECKSVINVSPGSGVFTRVNTNTLTAAQQQNYANWYSYYRTRMLMTRTAAGRAFQPLTNAYRVGFSTINDVDIGEYSLATGLLTAINAGQSFLNVRDYDSTQRDKFFARLYNIKPSGGTPLRVALGKAGLYYAKQFSGQTYDPVQYACQRNYSFLSTDGYWNGGTGKKLDRTTDVGQQDAADVRPYSDGGNSTVETPTVTVTRQQTTATQRTTTTGTRTQVNVTSTGCGFLNLQRQEVKQPQQKIDMQDDQVTTVSETTTGTKLVQTITNGVITSQSTVALTPSTATVSTTSTSITSTPGTWTNVGGSTTTCTGSSGNQGTTYYTNVSTSSSTTALGSPTVTTLSAIGPTTGAPTVTSTSGGASNTLADVAQYYYKTDLRTPALGNCTGSINGQDVCSNTLTASGRDVATWQHMTTFTLGLGVNGTLPYDRNYLDRENVATSTYYKLKAGTLSWPAPTADRPTAIDDLWHAAVNGRGQYFGANSATELTSSLAGALSGMTRTPGSGAAAGLSSRNPIAGTDYLVQAKYVSVDWTGDVVFYPFSDTSGDVDVDNPYAGTGKAGVDNLAARGGATDQRSIYYKQPSSTTRRDFSLTNLSADGLGGNFNNFCSQAVVPQQCASLNATQLALANSGTNLVAWLRGSDAQEEGNPDAPLYRKRLSALGDIVHSSPVTVGPPPFSYTDAGFAAFKATQSARQPIVLVGANDGMLHAFSARASDRGAEVWAYVPGAVMSKLYRLADTAYPSNHQYYVDATPAVGYIYAGGSWRTIVVGGLGAGGRGYYALDITDPTNPQPLWEFTETDLGLTSGVPVITKRADGTWVVAFGSGYNNTGNGYLYVLNAYTGAQLKKIPTYTTGTTPAGSATTPSGLAQINAWIADSDTNNTAKAFYGGDVLGNLWRFDIDNLILPNNAAQRLAVLRVNASTPQPITIRPELTAVTVSGTRYPIVVVGTGRYLGSTDVNDTTQQTLYAIKDPLSATDLGDARNNGSLVNLPNVRTGSTSSAVPASAMDWTTQSGWRMDLASGGERIDVSMTFLRKLLIAAANTPSATSQCSASGGGRSWRYEINVLDGTVTGSFLSDSLVSGIVAYVKPDGTASTSATSSGGDQGGGGGSSDPNEGTAAVFKRASWRELVN